MSQRSELWNVRTTTKLTMSALLILITAGFMAFLYAELLKIGEDTQERNTNLNNLTTHINTVRSNIQWVFFYENDLLLEQAQEDLNSSTYLYKKRINLSNRKNRLTDANTALDKLNQFLRNEEDKQLTQSLQKALSERLLRLEEEEKRNSAKEEENRNASEDDGLAPDEDGLEIFPMIVEEELPAISADTTLFAVEVKLRDLEKIRIAYANADKTEANSAIEENGIWFRNAIALALAALVITAVIFNNGILHPIETLMKTIKRVREGDVDARTELRTQNELGQLGTVLDELLDEKNTALAAKEEESSALNSSVITLIQNVFQLSQRDLSIRVPVAEDITGAVSDSINQLATSMETTLKDVINVSQQVDHASSQIRSQTEKVRTHTTSEQEEITETLKELESVINAMQLIAQLATVSHTTSKQAISTSETAMTSVSETINSINNIRQTIHEAEKRIKRLGERSQEIGGIVGLINNISERTHILSLNASMHAASAGEAGRGLTVVVDEVQRLAENSREATAEIETLVNNIQLETSDTIQVMNTVISEVVNGTRLAEEAGERMNETRTATSTLVKSVVRIAKSAVSQAKVAKQLHERATSIEKSTSITSSEMLQQSELSEQLVGAAEELQQSVSVFKLTGS